MSFGQETQDVFDSLPHAMQLAFMNQDSVALEECLLAMDSESAAFYMQQCVSVGLWVRTDADGEEILEVQDNEANAQMSKVANSNANSEELLASDPSTEVNEMNELSVEVSTVYDTNERRFADNDVDSSAKDTEAETDWNCYCCGMSNFWWRRHCRKCRTRSTTHAHSTQSSNKRVRDSTSYSRYHNHKKGTSPRHSPRSGHNRSRRRLDSSHSGRAQHLPKQCHRVLVSMGLGKYIPAFIEEGWTDIAGWHSLGDDTLRRDLGFKAGDIERFNRLKIRYIAGSNSGSSSSKSAREKSRHERAAAVAKPEELSVRFLRFSRDMASTNMDRLVYSISPLSFEGGLDRVHAKIYDFCFHCIPHDMIPSAVHNYFGDALCGHLTRPLEDDYFDEGLADRDDVSTAQFERRFVLDGGRAFVLRVMTDYHVIKKRGSSSHSHSHAHSAYGGGDAAGKYKYWAKFALALYADRNDKTAVEGSSEATTDTITPTARKRTRSRARSRRNKDTSASPVTPTAYAYSHSHGHTHGHTHHTKKGKQKENRKGRGGDKKRASTGGQRQYSCNLVFT